MQKSGLRPLLVPRISVEGSSGGAESFDAGLMLLNPGYITDDALKILFPSAAHSQVLWQTYLQNVHPLCKILHAPTFQKVVELARDSYHDISRSKLALLFSVYTFALTSMTSAECDKKLGHSKARLLKRLIYGTQQALYGPLSPTFLIPQTFKC
jgi:hypothetical protein